MMGKLEEFFAFILREGGSKEARKEERENQNIQNERGGFCSATGLWAEADIYCLFRSLIGLFRLY